MRISTKIAGTMSICFCMGLSFAPAAIAAGSPFLDVIVADRFFNRSEGHPSLRIRTRDEVLVDVLVYDESGRCVFVDSGTELQRKHDVQLAGLPEVSRGVFAFCLVARDNDGTRLGIYPDDPEGGEVVKVDDSMIDAKQDLIRYLLPRSSFVRIRAGIKDGPYLTPEAATKGQAPDTDHL